MKTLRYLLLFVSLATCALVAAPLQDNIKIDAMIVTKAELRRHMAASPEDKFRPATYTELAASRGPAQPDYLVVRFLMAKPMHCSGEAEVRIDGGRQSYRFTVGLHYNKGWVEYFIPFDGFMYNDHTKQQGDTSLSNRTPEVVVYWTRLESK